MLSTTAAASRRLVGARGTARALLGRSLAAANETVLDAALGCFGYRGIRAPSAGGGKDLRRLSTTPTPTPKGDDDGDSGGIVARAREAVLAPQNQFYLLVGGGAIASYAASRVVLSFTSFFTHLTPTVIAKWGFYTGFGFASLVGGAAFIAFDNLYIRADPVFRYAKKWVANDPDVRSRLGDGLTAGDLRSYRLDAGKVQKVGGSYVWRPPRIQMLFDVTASGPPYRTGLVTCEAVKAAGFPPRLKTSLLKVDYETGDEHEGGTHEGDETLFLAGSGAEMSRVSERSGLSLAMLARSVHINRAASGRQ